ncbi:MAG: hypothetical protein EP330_08490 [Deltaproteobacteria bacterium]|nr:MAG: hypothetical protein EP330_08490 [Deltaproteobacteria bacterium]
MIEAPQQGSNAMRSMEHEPESDGLDLWRLAETWATGPLSAFGRWQAGERRLAVEFDDLSDGEVANFRKSLPLRRVEIPGRGTFEDVTLEDVPIGPTSGQEAQRWAMARFDRDLSDKPGYRSRSALRERFAELTEDTPLESFAPSLPSHSDLLARAAKNPERFWTIAAPVDLSPFPPASEELDALRIGSPAPAPVVEPAGVVRVPYRGGWSMRRLVDRLMAGVAPRRLLLCDRYVRGDDNLQSLGLLIDSVRAIAPSVGVEVWTGDEEADFKKVQALTGTSPRSYREVFGRSWPHDRYLIVLPTQGPGFGWHMSNSPIHARADVQDAGPDTALRWKDLAATRVTADELQPALRQWLVGSAR